MTPLPSTSPVPTLTRLERGLIGCGLALPVAMTMALAEYAGAWLPWLAIILAAWISARLPLPAAAVATPDAPLDGAGQPLSAEDASAASDLLDSLID